MKIHECFPYIRVRNAAEAIDFYLRALNATERFRLVEPSGRIGHAELTVGPLELMLSDEFPEYGIVGPESIQATTFAFHLHVEDADAAIAHFVACGASLVRPPADHFYGERSGTVRDPYGHEWSIGHSIEKVTPEEMQRRYTAMFEP